MVQQHLDLLREQYVKLQQRHVELEQKYSRAISTTGDAGPDHFVSKLLSLTSDLYDKSLYRFDHLISLSHYCGIYGLCAIAISLANMIAHTRVAVNDPLPLLLL